jgi:hypothetical protein
MGTRPHSADCCHSLHIMLSRQHYQLCKISYRSVKGLRCGGGPKIAFSHRKAESSIALYCTTVHVVIRRRKRRQMQRVCRTTCCHDRLLKRTSDRGLQYFVEMELDSNCFPGFLRMNHESFTYVLKSIDYITSHANVFMHFTVRDVDCHSCTLFTL